MKIAVGSTVWTASLFENSSVAALKEILTKGPLTIQMNDYGRMEKVGSIGKTIPTNDEPTKTVPGDIILYQGQYLVIYYDHNSWDFTPIGKINGVTQQQLKNVLGKGNVSVTFSIE